MRSLPPRDLRGFCFAYFKTAFIIRHMEENTKQGEITETQPSDGQLSTEVEALKAELEKRDAEINEVVKQVKDEYAKKLEKLTADFEKRLADRQSVINQLLNDDGKPAAPSAIDQLNEKRRLQKRYWRQKEE